MSTNLMLFEELALLALREEDGRPLIGMMELDCGFAGAVLAELDLARRLQLVDSRLRVTDPTPVGHEGTDEVLSQLASDERWHKPHYWVRKLQSEHPRTEVLTGLAVQGLVTEQTSKLLGVIPVVRYPQVSRVPEAEIRDRLDAALHQVNPDRRTVALLSLVSGCGLARKLFAGADRSRVRELAVGHWVGLAVRSVIDMNYAAVATG